MAINIVTTITPATVKVSHSSLAGILSLMDSFTGAAGVTVIGRLDVSGGAAFAADTNFLNIKVTTNSPDARNWEVNVDKNTVTGYSVATVTSSSGLFSRQETLNFNKLVKHCVGLALAGMDTLTMVWTYA
jgi:hypothetical protein